MKVLIIHGSRRGGTAGIAELIRDEMATAGIDAEVRPAAARGSLDGVDAVVVGGALYANRWHRHARRFVRRHAAQLRERPVWLFSSGPLDDSATTGTIAAVPQVARLLEQVGARGHVTFGGRLEPDAKGFPASAMARTSAGDWRDHAQIGEWTREIVAQLVDEAAPNERGDRPAAPR